MAISHAEIATEHASKYLQQLCKHWSHRLVVAFDSETGSVEFPSGDRLVLGASGSTLSLDLHATDDSVTRMESVVADHLKRFAFREELAINWTKRG